MQPPKTATRRTPDIALANAIAGRIGRRGAVATAVTALVIGCAAPAFAINPGGGRHRIEAGGQAAYAQHADRSRVARADSSSYLDEELYKLRMCESGGNYRANTGNGYYGAYQFALQTWQDLGMTGRPDQASPDEQDYAAKVLHARAGWGPWPACAQKENLN